MECGQPLKGRRQRWCGDACVHVYKVRADPAYARDQVEHRDKGVCRECGLDTLDLQRQLADLDRNVINTWWEQEGNAIHAQHMGRYAIYARPSVEVTRHHQRSWSWATKAVGPRIEKVRRAFLRSLGLEQYWWRKTLWDADHVLPVAHGGGGCDLDNLQTLCVKCHAKKTAAQAQRRLRLPKKIPRKRYEWCRTKHGQEQGACSLREDRLCWGCRHYRDRVRKAKAS